MTTRNGGKWDVAVVGLGPVGAVLSGLLGRRGLRVIAMDRSLDVFPLPRAAHIDHTGLRTLQEMADVDSLLADMVPNRSLDLVTADHRLLLRVPGNQGSVSGLPASMYFYQPDFDRALEDAVRQFRSVEVRRGTEMLHLDASAEAVRLYMRTAGGEEEEISASWLVGCDGAASQVREALGIKLESLDFDERWLVVDLALRRSQTMLTDNAIEVCDPRRPHVTTPIPGGRQRFEFMLFEHEDAASMLAAGNVARLLEPWLAAGTYEVERSTIYTFHGLVAERWREERVLLAGDAAHQMPPFLGQGMCSGIRDAANLAWKLDLVVRGVAPESLLDTYMDERKPHVRAVVKAAVDIGRLVCERDPAEAAERDRRLLSGKGASEIAFRLPPLGNGTLILPGGGGLFPQISLSDGERLDDRVGSQFLVLARDAKALGTTSSWWEQALGAVVATVSELDDQEGTLDRWLETRGANVAVVRPDHYVLGRGDELNTITDAVRPFFDETSHERRSSREHDRA